MRINETLRWATQTLNEVSDSPRLDSEILLSHVISKPRSYLYTWPELALDETVLDQFQNLMARRQTGYPIAYLTGYQEFWSLGLQVTPDVLVPRADTELLVETALDKLQHTKTPRILELGTGSGAISLAIAHERPDASLLATDLSQAPLAVATSNQARLRLNNIEFLQSNWFQSIPSETRPFDLVLSNPPYIDPDDVHLQSSIRYEPRHALCATQQGLADLKQIITHVHAYLKPAAWVLLEHGHDQGDRVTTFLSQAGFQDVLCLKDLASNDRVSVARHPG